MLHRDEAITEASESVYFYGGRTSGASGEGVTVAQGVPRDKGGQRGGQAGTGLEQKQYKQCSRHLVQA